MPAQPIRAVAYFRKSNEDDGNSVQQQREWARDAAQREAITIVREFEDQARSGWKTHSREDFHAMLAFCQEEAKAGHPIDAIVCWAPDRFSRADSQETGWFLWEFRKAGTERMFSQTRGWLDFARPEHRALFGMEQDFGANAYVVNLSQAVLRGRLKAAKEGRYMNGAAPLGYLKVPRPGGGARLVFADDATVELVRWIFRRFLEPDGSLHTIARELTARGIPTPRGKPAWTPRAVKLILSNPTYLGRLEWNRTSRGHFARIIGFTVKELNRDNRGQGENPSQEWVEKEGTHEALIDPDTFERVQRKLAQMRRGRRHAPNAYPLSGLLVCGHCGKRMTGVTVRRPRKAGGHYAYPRYCCQSYGAVNGCSWNSIETDRVLQALVRRLRQTVYREENIRKAVAEIRRQDQKATEAGPNRAGKLRQQLAALAGKLVRAEGRFADEEDETLWPALRKRVQELRDQQAEAAAELAALERQTGQETADLDALAEDAVAGGLQLEKALADGDLDLVRELILLAVDYVELFFVQEKRGKRTRSVFARGIIHVREGFPFVGKRYCFSEEYLLPDKTIALTAADLEIAGQSACEER